MKYVIGICDDLAEERNALGQMVRSYCASHRIAADIRLYASGEELLAGYEPNRFHILFLDIYMPGISGMDTARQIRRTDSSCAIVFATTSMDHGLDSYDVQASDYLVKPIRPQAVDDALDWCFGQLARTNRTVKLTTEKGDMELPVRDIRYIEIRSHTAWLFTEQGVLTTRRGMDELEKEVDCEDFIRCHRSFLVNLDYVQWMEKNVFRLRTGEEVPIGSTNLSRVKDRYMDWTFVRSWNNK